MPAPSLPIKIGFIGLSSSGWAANSHGPALVHPSLKNTYKLTAISTSNAGSAAASVAKYSQLAGNDIKPYHGPSTSIAEDENVDLVAISVKAYLHKGVVLPVIERGKDFFLEWPAGKSLEETEDIRAAAMKKGVKGFVGLQGRTSGVMKKIKQLVDSGAIGKILSSTFVGVLPLELQAFAPFQSQNDRYILDPSNGVSPLIVPAGHQLDSITHILGPLTSVTASGTQAYPNIKMTKDGNETGETFKNQHLDHLTFSGTLENGAHSSFIMRLGGMLYPGRKTLRWEIEGEDGSILVESESPMGLFMSMVHPNLYLNGEKVEVEGVQSGMYDAVGMLVDLWKEYAKGEEVGQYATLDDAVRNRRIIDAVERSAKEGRRITVDLKL